MYRDIDEQNLVRLCSDKDRQAQMELYNRYAARLFSLCRRYSDTTDEARDLVHDTMLKALDRIDTFTCSGKGSLYAWISRIAINMALNNIKRYKFRFVRQDAYAMETVPEPPPEALERIPEEKLLEFISELPDTQRTIFNLFCLDGYSHREIAEKIGISERGSTSLLAKAKHQLKKRINEYLKDSENNEII